MCQALYWSVSMCSVTQSTGTLGRGSGSIVPVTDEETEEHRFTVNAKVTASECMAGLDPVLTESKACALDPGSHCLPEGGQTLGARSQLTCGTWHLANNQAL